MLTWLVSTPKVFVRLLPGETLNTFVRFYWLDAVANSDAEFGMRVLTLAGSSTLVLFH